MISKYSSCFFSLPDFVIGILFIALFPLFNSCKNQSKVSQPNYAHTNDLIHESSPYLLQHAHNPVNWHAWNDVTLKKAKEEDKLLIISIGYAACHWCHVMEHESFEDSTVAAIMNEYFIPIKVDREERPDVDDVYMSAAQLISGSGGWPLNAFALSDGRPIWAGTYFPRDRWIEILQQFANLKQHDYQKLVKSADQLTQGIGSLDAIELIKSDIDFEPELIKSINQKLIQQMDPEEGGRRGAPKFPMPNNWEYLLKYADVNKDDQSLQLVFTTLNKMAQGGIYDQVGGGFARYSTDAIWKAPHFEKMLYDNGQLISLYSQAYQKTGDPLYAKVIKQTLEFVNRELSDPGGGFYSSLDADSEGEEGKYYVWTTEELDSIIGDSPHYDIYKDLYSVKTGGNWEKGQNILHMSQSISEIATRYDITSDQLQNIIDNLNNKILEKRTTRIRPGLDDKILTSWNALMIKGYVDAYKALGEEDYLDQAVMNAHFILKEQMENDSRLNRNYKNEKSSINAFLDDYALLVDALLGLYEVTFDESWLNVSKELINYTLAHFYNESNGMFYYTSDKDAPLVARKMELSDNVIPASNSVMARNLAKLGEIFYDEKYTSVANQMLNNMLPTISQTQQPGFYSNWLQLLFDKIYTPFEVAVIGPQANAVASEMMKNYNRNALFLGGISESHLPLLEYKYIPDKTMIYVCKNKVCKLPVTDINQALQLMK